MGSRTPGRPEPTRDPRACGTTLAHLEELTGVDPEAVALDLHPGTVDALGGRHAMAGGRRPAPPCAHCRRRWPSTALSPAARRGRLRRHRVRRRWPHVGWRGPGRDVTRLPTAGHLRYVARRRRSRHSLAVAEPVSDGLVASCAAPAVDADLPTMTRGRGRACACCSIVEPGWARCRPRRWADCSTPPRALADVSSREYDGSGGHGTRGGRPPTSAVDGLCFDFSTNGRQPGRLDPAPVVLAARRGSAPAPTRRPGAARFQQGVVDQVVSRRRDGANGLDLVGALAEACS